MRIISQDKCYDMPYEQTMLTNIGTKIYADNLAVKELCVAKYSTEEKAEKAMEMCRNRYALCKTRNHGMNSLTMTMSFLRTDEIEQLLETFAEKNISICTRTRKTPEEIKAQQKEYQHKYYMEVTKKKRAQKRVETNKK